MQNTEEKIMQTTTITPNQNPELDLSNHESDDKLKAHIVRRNIEDYLEQKALDRRLTEVIDEKHNFGW